MSGVQGLIPVPGINLFEVNTISWWMEAYSYNYNKPPLGMFMNQNGYLQGEEFKAK